MAVTGGIRFRSLPAAGRAYHTYGAARLSVQHERQQGVVAAGVLAKRHLVARLQAARWKQGRERRHDRFGIHRFDARTGEELRQRIPAARHQNPHRFRLRQHGHWMGRARLRKRGRSRKGEAA